MKRVLRVTLFACLAAIAAAVVFVVLRPASRTVATAVVDRGPVEEVIRATGRTHVRKRYTITVPLEGYLPSLPWHAGDRVRSGDVLFQMLPAPDMAFDPRAQDAARSEAERTQAALAAAQATGDTARMHAEFAETEYVRLEQAFAAGDVAWKDLELAEQVLKDARAHLRVVEFSIDVARHELNAANLRVDYLRDDDRAAGPVPVRTPLGGVVLSVAANHGENAEGSAGRLMAGAPLLEIGDPATLEIRVDVSTADAMRLEPGSVARIVGWVEASDDPLAGRVRRIEPAAFTKISARGTEEQRVRAIVEITSPREQWAKLGDAFPVDVEFVAWRNADAVRVPVATLYRQEDRWMVLRIRGERAYGTPVMTGHHGEHYVEVLDGLLPGDVLVLEPESIDDGERVTARLKASAVRP